MQLSSNSIPIGQGKAPPRSARPGRRRLSILHSSMQVSISPDPTWTLLSRCWFSMEPQAYSVPSPIPFLDGPARCIYSHLSSQIEPPSSRRLRVAPLAGTPHAGSAAYMLASDCTALWPVVFVVRGDYQFPVPVDVALHILGSSAATPAPSPPTRRHPRPRPRPLPQSVA